MNTVLKPIQKLIFQLSHSKKATKSTNRVYPKISDISTEIFAVILHKKYSYLYRVTKMRTRILNKEQLRARESVIKVAAVMPKFISIIKINLPDAQLISAYYMLHLISTVETPPTCYMI